MAPLFHLLSPFGPVSLKREEHFLAIEATDALAADWGLGWWHGREGDAVLARSLWRGTLSRSSRPSWARSELDAFVSQWNFSAHLSDETNHLAAGHRARVHAYTQGFNQGWKRPRGEQPWSVEDCHLLVRALGFWEWWETRAPQWEFFGAAWAAGLPWSHLNDLWPGLGHEPGRPHRSFQAAFAPETQALVDQLRRFRPSPSWTLGGRSALLGGSYISDVSDPGLPFLPVRVDLPTGRVRGLSRPGHPGFLAGRTRALAWHAAPAVDDIIDLRLHDAAGTVAGVWAGGSALGTLGALLALETAATVQEAEEATRGGSAALDITAADSQGGHGRWAHGPRWLRPRPSDAWNPAPWNSAVPVGTRVLTPVVPPRFASLDALAAHLVSARSTLPEQSLEGLRFLLPETDLGQRLRRWTGLPDAACEAAFERLYGAVWSAFWEPSPLVPAADSPLAQALAPRVEQLLRASHSAWLPSADKNRRLAEAARRAFAPGSPPGPALLRRWAPRARWVEQLGGRAHTFAATVAVACDMAEATWRVFHTDDADEEPRYHTW